jgi:uncharacterized protein YjiK
MMTQIAASVTPGNPTPDPTLSPTLEAIITPGSASNGYATVPYVVVDTINSGALSGITFHPGRKTLFAVSDEGHILEMETGGTILHQERVRKGADFEGIAFNPVTGLLYVAIEGDEVILEVKPDTLEVIRDIPIDRVFDESVLLDPKGNGVEGITFVPARNAANGGVMGGTFYLVNQGKELGDEDPPIVFEVDIIDSENGPQAKIVRYFDIGSPDLSGIHYEPSWDQLIVISDSDDLAIEVTLDGELVNAYPLPGKDQEGITIDRDGFLYIAQDSSRGLLKFSPSVSE